MWADVGVAGVPVRPDRHAVTGGAGVAGVPVCPDRHAAWLSVFMSRFAVGLLPA